MTSVVLIAWTWELFYLFVYCRWRICFFSFLLFTQFVKAFSQQAQSRWVKELNHNRFVTIIALKISWIKKCIFLLSGVNVSVNEVSSYHPQCSWRLQRQLSKQFIITIQASEDLKTIPNWSIWKALMFFGRVRCFLLFIYDQARIKTVFLRHFCSNCSIFKHSSFFHRWYVVVETTVLDFLLLCSATFSQH